MDAENTQDSPDTQSAGQVQAFPLQLNVMSS